MAGHGIPTGGVVGAFGRVLRDLRVKARNARTVNGIARWPVPRRIDDRAGIAGAVVAQIILAKRVRCTVFAGDGRVSGKFYRRERAVARILDQCRAVQRHAKIFHEVGSDAWNLASPALIDFKRMNDRSRRNSGLVGQPGRTLRKLECREWRYGSRPLVFDAWLENMISSAALHGRTARDDADPQIVIRRLIAAARFVVRRRRIDDFRGAGGVALENADDGA